jgi:secreted PhoX family phosphatase
MKLEELINRRISRRSVIKAAAFFTAGAVLPVEFFSNPFTKRSINELKKIRTLPFPPISPSSKDELVLPEGFEYSIIRKWGDMISDTEYYGYNNDYVDYLPIDLLLGGNNSNDGLLAVNHEYPFPLFVSGYTYEDQKSSKLKSREQIELEKKCVGMSIFRVKKEGGRWNFVMDSQYNRRIDANTEILLTGRAAGSPEMMNSNYAIGSVGNCSGGKTPWGTVLSGEENFQDYPAGSAKDEWGYRWRDQGDEFIAEHQGWVMEVDPFDKSSIPRKRTSLGRFRHENVAISIAPDGRIAAYMGDDKANECVYKFVSFKKFDSNNREANFDLLDEGDLYAADFLNNKWQLLDYGGRKDLRNNFRSQADVLVNCDRAAKIAGATECNRPEDIQIHPLDKSVYIAFTNNSRKKDYFGSIVRIIEDNNDPAGETFEWEVFAAGGVGSGFSCPDNLTFDSKGNLWVLSDISTEKINKGSQEPFKNNSLFMIPTGGKNAGKVFRFASGPVDSEMCGGSFTPDELSMFISIQHPGEGTTDLNNPTSRWPDYGSNLPKPAVVAVTGFK